MHDLLFEHQEALEDEDLTRYAADLELDSRREMAELLAGEHISPVREDFHSGAHGGVNGTPTFFINGVRFTRRTAADALIAALTQ